MKDLLLLAGTADLTGESHDHIAYLNDEVGRGASSYDHGHSHEIQFIPAQPPQQDEQGNVIAEGQKAHFLVMPAADGHMHDFAPYDYKKTSAKEPEDDVIRDVLHLYKTARELESESLEKGQESEKFYMGEQWPSTVKQELESVSRAALTINLTAPKIDELCGYQRQQRTDLRYVPLEGGDQLTADILNVVTKNILEQCFFEREESEVFEDEVIVGRGLFNFYVDRTNDIRGEIKVERFPWDQVHFGPHEKKDLTDCEYLVKHKMYSKAKLKQLWPDKADKVEQSFDLFASPNKEVTIYREDQYAHSDNRIPAFLGDTSLVNMERKEFRLIECWRRVYMTIAVIADPEAEFYFNAHNWKPADITRARTIPGMIVIDKPGMRMRISRIAGNVVLSDESPADLPVDDFMIVPVYAKKRGDKFWGKVEAAKDPQKEINKRHSQAVDIGNKMAAYGWFYDATTFPDNEKEKFKRTSTSPGFTTEVTDTGRIPVKVEGTKFPGEIVELMRLGDEKLSQIMNITIPDPGANTSGAAMQTQLRQRLTGNEFLFDNLAFAKKRIGRILVSFIQRFYTPERVMRILENKNAKNPVALAGQPLEQYSEDDILEVLQTADLAQYDVVVSESAYGPTTRLVNFFLLSDLAKGGVQIPPEVLIDFADMPEETKQKVLQSIAAQAEAQATAEQQTSQTEIQKTLIAKGLIPPAIAEQYGVQIPGQPQVEKPQPTQIDESNTLAA